MRLLYEVLKLSPWHIQSGGAERNELLYRFVSLHITTGRGGASTISQSWVCMCMCVCICVGVVLRLIFIQTSHFIMVLVLFRAGDTLLTELELLHLCAYVQVCISMHFQVLKWSVNRKTTSKATDLFLGDGEGEGGLKEGQREIRKRKSPVSTVLSTFCPLTPPACWLQWRGLCFCTCSTKTSRGLPCLSCNLQTHGLTFQIQQFTMLSHIKDM